MYGKESEIPWELNSVSFLVCIENMDVSLKAISPLSSLSSDPLFSSIITLYSLILLYLPHIFFTIIFSPVLIITGILLLFLLRLGAIQRFEIQSKENSEDGQNRESKSTEAETTAGLPLEEPKWVACKTETKTGFDPNPDFEENFVEWNVRAPLEVIYEAYEGEEEEEEYSDLNESNLNDKDPTRLVGIERYPSLSLYYPESDSDSSLEWDLPATGDWVLPENICFRWEEDDREGFIEIALENENKQRDLDFRGEEENLIEIDLSPLLNQ